MVAAVRDGFLARQAVLAELRAGEPRADALRFRYTFEYVRQLSAFLLSIVHPARHMPGLVRVIEFREREFRAQHVAANVKACALVSARPANHSYPRDDHGRIRNRPALHRA